MRRARLTLSVIGLLVSGVPAHAQTYDPNYPVCMQIYGPVGYADCRYTSIAQCKYLAVGRSATCIVNPYFPQKRPDAARRAKRADLGTRSINAPRLRG